MFVPARFAAFLAVFAFTFVVPGCTSVERWWDLDGGSPPGTVETEQSEKDRQAAEEEARRSGETRLTGPVDRRQAERGA